MELFYEDNIQFKIEENFGDCAVNEQHFHDLIEFFYLCSGKTYYFIDNKTYYAEKGDLLIIPPNTIHKAVPFNANKRKRRLIYLRPEFAQSLVGEETQNLNKVMFFKIGENERISQIISQLLDEYNGQHNLYYVKALLCEFLILLSRRGETKDLVFQSQLLSNRISEVILYINENYSEDITLNSTAEKLFINPSYLSRIFKQNTGFSFSAYLNKYRILKALTFLASGDKNITEIAFACGFNSSNHFCKTFKALIGISPLSYRKNVDN